MPEVKDKKVEPVLDDINKDILSYAEAEEAEADRILAEATGQELPEKKQEEEEPSKGLEKSAKEEPEKKPEPELEAEDLTKGLTVENAQKRISATQDQMHKSNTAASEAKKTSDTLTAENVELRRLLDERLKEAPVEDIIKAKKEEGEEAAREPGEAEAAIEALKAEYPEIADPVLKVLEASMAENKKLADRIGAQEKRESDRDTKAKEGVKDAHVTAIAEVHPDYQEISEEPLFDKWINELPAIEKAGANIIRNDGSSGDVIELLTKFKEANGYEMAVKEEAAVPSKDDSRLKKAKELSNPSFKKAKEINTLQGKVLFTREQIANWSEKEWAENEDAVDAAMAKGLVQ